MARDLCHYTRTRWRHPSSTYHSYAVKHTIWRDRTSDLPICSAAPQPLCHRSPPCMFQYDPETKLSGMDWKTKSLAWPKIFACKCRGSKRWCSLFTLSQLFSLSTNSEWHAGAGRVTERNMETEWRHSWFVLRDGAAAHSAIAVKRLLANRIVVDLSYPPCSPDLAPANFIPLCKTTATRKGGKFGGGGLDVKNNLTAEVNAVIFEHSMAVLCNV